MLQFIRNNTKGVLAWIIVGILIVPFALWGVNEYFGGGSGDVTIAKVGDRDIQTREFQNLFQRELINRREAGLDVDAGNPAIRRQVLDRLINAEVMSQAAVSSGFRISDERVGMQIRSMREFQTDGQFDPELYDRLLRASGMSRGGFEENVRRDLMMEQLLIGVAETSLLTEHELDRWLRLSDQQRRFGYLVLEADDYLDMVEVSDDEIQRYYRENMEQFAVPEQVRADYVELSQDGLRDTVHVDEEILQRMYERQVTAFSVDEERRVSHILLETDPDDSASVAAATELAAELRSRLDDGASFAELAREYSDDPGSADTGGDLGLVSRGMMTGPFEDAVFALGEGEISDPVQTSFGIHLIEVTGIRAGSTRSFEDVRDELEENYRRGRADEQFFELTELLADMTFEHPDTLEIAAEELNLEIHRTDWFSRRQGDGIAADETFRQTAFSNDVIEAGNNSPLVEMQQDRVVVLRISDREPATHRPMAEVRDRIIRELRLQGAARLAAEEADSMLERINAGEPIDAVAEQQGLRWHDGQVATRDDSVVPVDVLDAVFRMQAPGGDSPRIEVRELLSGNHAVISLQEVLDGRPGAIAEDRRQMELRNITRMQSQRAADDLLRSLKDRIGVRVNEDRL